ncbi:MarR family winged helix-turn-helix transcriptional regulator [Streptomyces sp. NPDC058683]|uniref:MarR family winged helix-turn-helix transcriptional regulator n=1 Tax=Streptomyces sp. NPDC058683 TaxID=3346597 RepID=UPI00366769EB
MHNEVMDSGGSGEELVVAFEQLVRYVRQVSTAGGLSSAASSVLGRLGREGPQRLTELARAEGVSQPGMTQLVTRMERDGLVRRIASTDDRRGVLVEATDAGAALVRQRRAERAEALRALMDRLDPQEQSAVVIALPALARLIQAEASK